MTVLGELQLQSLSRRVVQLPIHVYRRLISPILPAACRFYPSCSQYALDAVEKHGTVRGVMLAAARFLRCGPWHPGGVDFVPPPTSKGSSVCP